MINDYDYQSSNFGDNFAKMKSARRQFQNSKTAKIIGAVGFGNPNAFTSDNESESEQKEPTIYDRFPVKKYDRPVRTALLIFCLIAVICFIVSFIYQNNDFVSNTFFCFASALTIFSFVYLVLSIKWARNYTIDDDGFLIPGEKFELSISSGRERDVFIDADNRLRKFLLQCDGLPERANNRNFKWECVEISPEKTIYEIYIRDVLGGYDFLNKNLKLLSVEFGDPDGAELKKIAPNKYELTFDKLGGGIDYNKTVDYWAEVD